MFAPRPIARCLSLRRAYACHAGRPQRARDCRRPRRLMPATTRTLCSAKAGLAQLVTLGKPHDEAGADGDINSSVRAAFQNQRTRYRFGTPDPAFVAAMPLAFRDALRPAAAATRSRPRRAPRPASPSAAGSRPVTYRGRVRLARQRALRCEQTRPRALLNASAHACRDPAFRRDIRQHLHDLPDWRPLLQPHPRPAWRARHSRSAFSPTRPTHPHGLDHEAVPRHQVQSRVHRNLRDWLNAAGIVANHVLQQQSLDETRHDANVLMSAAEAMQNYTAQHITPLLSTQIQYSFVPESVPAFSAIEMPNTLQGAFPNFSYRSTMLNPTNLRDRPTDWETEVIAHLRRRPR